MLDVAALKRRIRQRAQMLRLKLSTTYRDSWSQAITAQICSLAAVQRAKTVMFYRAFQNEPNIDSLFARLQESGTRCALPRVIDETNMEACLIHDLEQEMKPGFKGILEPVEVCPIVAPEEIDVIIIPGNSFDRAGHRLGSGMGFYDRYLARPEVNAVKIGIAYTFAILEEIPNEPHDVQMDYIVTEEHVLDCKAGKVVSG